MSAQNKADYSFLGRTGLKVSNVCLGTNMFGISEVEPLAVFNSNPKRQNEVEAHKLLDRYIELGGNFLDTADVYGAGISQKIIGNWLKTKRRSDIIISSKVWFPMDWNTKNNIGLSRRHIINTCDETLERLQTNYIDLFQAHIWDNATPIEDTLRTFDDLVRCGKIRYYGFSNICGWQLQKIVDLSRHLNLHPCISLQQQYSLLSRESEVEAFMVCENERICVLPWSPLKGGLLTGKFKRNNIPDATGSRVGHMIARKASGESVSSDWEKFCDDEQYWNLIALMEKFAKAKGKTVAQVAIRWLLQKDIVASVIIGCSSIQQLEDNMGASSGWKLSEEEMQELDKASRTPYSYPYNMLLGTFSTSRMNRFNSSQK
ncbi:1-deoxyxylulose-5-phosphate synthase YajO-like isoform X2 [Mercenaria mercenaria]|nr:1-deoxyxylulose-5-phosphate synthase YajO-like isoform X2 [Mercenaria mercenaria]XP_045182531.1 1-deoxyxylulose-5-phosphate synthase YajO-like isoform X2 [Mercenaria mercenaria]